MNISWLALEKIKGLFEVIKNLTHNFMKCMYVRLAANLKTSLQILLALEWNVIKGSYMIVIRTALNDPADFL